jgi:hypothetical protein
MPFPVSGERTISSLMTRSASLNREEHAYFTAEFAEVARMINDKYQSSKFK